MGNSMINIFLLHLCIVSCLLGMNKTSNWHYLLYRSVPDLLVVCCGLLCQKRLWDQVYTLQAETPLSHAFWICSVISTSALFVELLGLNLNCWDGSCYFLPRMNIVYIYNIKINFSSILLILEISDIGV